MLSEEENSAFDALITSNLRLTVMCRPEVAQELQDHIDSLDLGEMYEVFPHPQAPENVVVIYNLSEIRAQMAEWLQRAVKESGE